MVLGYRLTANFVFAILCVDTVWSSYTCVHLGTTCSLFKRVYPYQLGASSSDVLGICFVFDYMSMDMCQACEWNSQQLAEWITHVPLFWLTARGYRLTPLFQCLSAWIAPIPEWGNPWGSRMPTSLFLISLPTCSGKLEGRRPGLKLKRFLDGILHRAVAIEGACYSLHHALESTLLNLSSTAFKSHYSWGVSWLSP